MSTKSIHQRREQADSLASRLVAAVTHNATHKHGIQEGRQAAQYTIGYLEAMLASLAAQSPKALEELEASVRWAER